MSKLRARGRVAGREHRDLVSAGDKSFSELVDHQLGAAIVSRRHRQELATVEIDAGTIEQNDRLHRKSDISVYVLMQAVVAISLVVKQKRRRLGLPGLGAPREKLVERR